MFVATTAATGTAAATGECKCANNMVDVSGKCEAQTNECPTGYTMTSTGCVD